MVATLILVRDDNGDLHDHEGHLRNGAGQRIDAKGAAILESDANATCTTLPVNEVRDPRHWLTTTVVGTEIHTLDFRLNKESRRTLISKRSRISANTTRQTIRTRNKDDKR
ncbi:hypothetical protein F2Q68_00035341 [Brassica cretica]|uniref:Uncharacterized protein n=1 Tax=Brassica cretica TaxID=69181 RepID=A0A8S9GY76_BRACR|nr:hypothetical protein F2Q68_00035341 [Brassica cretica]